VLVPQRHFHRNAQRPVTAAAIRTTLKEDLHVALISWEDTDSTITLQVRVSPLAAWRWIGAAVLVLGTAIAICPRPRKEVLEDRIEEEIMRLRQAGGGVPKVETLKCGK
jgi:cytochrome c biogenesis factor